MSARDRIAVAVGSFGLAGFFPLAPATLASAIATILFAFVLPLPAWASVALVVGLLVAGVWACGRIERLYGRDPAAAVLDEVCGMAVTLATVPITPMTLGLGFVLFRVFDILKLPPGRAAERLHGGWGIMLDDVVAGVYAALVLRLCLWLWPDLRLERWHVVAAAATAVVLFLCRKPLQRRYAKPRTQLRRDAGSR